MTKKQRKYYFFFRKGTAWLKKIWLFSVKKIHVSLSARHGRPMLCIGYVVVLPRARDLANSAVEVSKNIGLLFLIHWAKASETLILACCNEISDGVEDMFVAWFVLQLISFCSFKGVISSVQKENTSIVWEKNNN
jgi:hypothetical protein